MNPPRPQRLGENPVLDKHEAVSNTNVLIYFTPHPPLPLKGGGEGRGEGDVTLFNAFVLIQKIGKGPKNKWSIPNF